MKRLIAIVLAALPLLAAGCGEVSPPANPKVEGPAKHAASPIARPAAENVGPVDSKGRPRSLTTDY